MKAVRPLRGQDPLSTLYAATDFSTGKTAIRDANPMGESHKSVVCFCSISSSGDLVASGTLSKFGLRLEYLIEIARHNACNQRSPIARIRPTADCNSVVMNRLSSDIP